MKAVRPVITSNRVTYFQMMRSVESHGTSGRVKKVEDGGWRSERDFLSSLEYYLLHFETKFIELFCDNIDFLWAVPCNSVL